MSVSYRPCPKCGLSAANTLLSANIRRDTAVFECPCGCVYALHFTRGGLLLDTTGTYLDDPGMRAAHVRSVHRG